MNRRTRALQFRPDMISYIEEYMKRLYPEWNREMLVYHK